VLSRSALAQVALLALLAAGCDPEDPVDGGADAGQRDAGPPRDAGYDGGTDAGTFDAGPCAPATLPALGTEELVVGHRFTQPTDLVQSPGDLDTFYVVEQPGRILVVRDGAVLPEPFLDITDRVTLIGERGLLGLAFHPDYPVNGRFFVYYTDGDPPRDDPAYNLIAEYARLPGEELRADPTEVTRLLAENPTRGNHAGGHIAFGPDGYLWGGMGDGASLGDLPDAQNTDNPHGGIVRLDVDAPASGYTPPDNPYPDGYPLLWAHGLRNPWRWSFDRETGDLYIADVGELLFEEINITAAGSTGGEDYGWPAFEAESVFDAMYDPLVTDHHAPAYVIARDGSDPYHAAPCSVSGGYVYRGREIPGLWGYYLYGDYCDPAVAAFRWCEGAIVDHQSIDDLRWDMNGLAAFAEDIRGELYMLNNNTGEIVKIVAR